MKNIASNNIEILNKSILDIFDTIIMELPEFDTGCFSQYMQDFNSKRCNILVKFSLCNSDTLVDFFTYDTTQRNAVENVVVNGLLKKMQISPYSYLMRENLQKEFYTRRNKIGKLFN